jgi:hypothetical protein
MIFSLTLFITFLFICLTLLMVLGTFWIAQFVIERFIIQTLPILVELYGRIRYPDDFKD